MSTHSGEECKRTVKGTEYSGHAAKTKSGRICQRWNKQFPHKHTRTNIAKFPDHSLKEAGNYCRNPDGSSRGPWCYTTDKGKRWEYCNIPKCHGECYSGIISKELMAL